MSTARKIWLFIAMLYAITWIGGFRLHSLALKKQAQSLYDESRKAKAETDVDRAHIGLAPYQSDLLPGGPVAIVNWCIPILPGVLIADSGYIIGSLRGGGGIRILVFYGSGLWDSEPIGGWVM